MYLSLYFLGLRKGKNNEKSHSIMDVMYCAIYLVNIM